MTDSFLITLDALRSKSPCASGYRWVAEHYPNGCDYQELLNALCENYHPDWAEWLLGKFGRTNAVYEADEIKSEKGFVFAGSVKIKNFIDVKLRLVAGCGIEAGEGIEAGDGIEAGPGLS